MGKTFSKYWNDYNTVHKALLDARSSFFESDMSSQIYDLRLVLSNFDREDLYIALDLLRVAGDRYKVLIKEMVMQGLDGQEVFAAYMREVLELYKDSCKEDITRCVNEYVLSHLNDEFIYHNVCCLYYLLGYKAELNLFVVEYCKENTDNNIVELYDDYFEV